MSFREKWVLYTSNLYLGSSNFTLGFSAIKLKIILQRVHEKYILLYSVLVTQYSAIYLDSSRCEGDLSLVSHSLLAPGTSNHSDRLTAVWYSIKTWTDWHVSYKTLAQYNRDSEGNHYIYDTRKDHTAAV